MKKEIIYWFCSIIVSVSMMNALMYFGHDGALLLTLVICVLCYLFYRSGIKRPLFTSILCGGFSIGTFFLMILSIPLVVNTWYGNIFASTCAILCLMFILMGVSFDTEERERFVRYNIINTSLSGYTEGDYKFPTDEKLAEIHKKYC